MRKKKGLLFTEDEDNCIEFKTVFGIKPGIYLSVYYCIILVLILFMFLVYPGIKNYGSRISFAGNPDEVSVWIDDIYAGTTPFTAFVEKGSHTVKYRKAGFAEISEKIDIKGYFFATLLKKPEIEIARNLEIEELEHYLKWNLNELTAWGGIGSFYSSYQPEKILSESMKNLPEVFHDDEIVESYLTAAYKNITDEYLFNDLLKSVYYYRSDSNPVLSSSDYLNTIAYLAKKVSSNKKLFLYSAKIMGDEARSSILPNGKSDMLFRSYEKKLVKNGELSSPYSEEKIRGRKYVKIPSGRYLFGNGDKDFVPSVIKADYEIPHNIYLESFFISSNEVTNSDYYSFIRENNIWAKSNIESLMEDGLVNEDYLKDWRDDAPVSEEKNFSVRFVSFYAAQAYCEWLSTKLGSDLRNYKIALPDEYQWEAAASYSEKHSRVLLDVKGSLWEWCGNWFFPGDFINPSTGTGTDLMIEKRPVNTDMFRSIEKSVRGGSWVNNNVKISTRASQPPQWCTPFLGFRPVLMRINNVRK